MKQLLQLGIVILVLSLMQACVSTKPERKEDPEKAAIIYTDLGLQYLRQGDLEMALDRLQRSLELNSRNPAANHYIAEVYKQLGNTQLADKYFKLAVRYDRDDPMVLNNYGAFLCEQGRFQESENYFLRAAKVHSYRTPELAYENLALCALQDDNKETAEEYFRKALQIRPNLAKSLYQMALISYDKREYLVARAFIQRFHSLVQTEQSLKLGIQIEEALGDMSAAEKYREALSTLSSNGKQE